MASWNPFEIAVSSEIAFYIMDRGYLDFARLFKLHQRGAFFGFCRIGVDQSSEAGRAAENQNAKL